MFYGVIGYALAVLFPIPFLNAFIVGLWANFGTKIELWIKGAATAAPVSTPAPSAPPQPPITGA